MDHNKPEDHEGDLKLLHWKMCDSLRIAWVILDTIVGQGCLGMLDGQGLAMQPDHGRMLRQHLFAVEFPPAEMGIAKAVQATQAGDSAAYEALIQRFQPMAYTTAYRSLGDHHLVAQDLVQEAVIEALVHLSQRKRAGCLPWQVSPDCLSAMYPCA